MTTPWLLLAFALATPAATPTPAPTAAPTAVPTPAPTAGAATPLPSAVPVVSPAPSETPSATPSAIPSQWPTRPPLPPMNYKTVPKPVASPDPNQPLILEIDLNEKLINGLIAIRVVTSPSVVKVVSSSNGYSGQLPQVGPGEFAAVHSVPKLPLTWSTSIVFVATSADGRAATVKVPVKIK
jgi:hypothetical protein